MFKKLRDTIIALNSDVNNVANCEKAKKLRKKLMTIGLILTIIGGLGVIGCFAGFAISGMNFGTGSSMGFPTGVIVCFVLFLPFGVILSIGCALLSLAVRIVITGYTTNLIDETIGNNCPKCGADIAVGASFCAKCGAKIIKECPNCKHVNSHKSAFCEKCGTKLD